MELLTSLKNPRVQAWRALKDRKARKEQQAFLVEGRKMVEEAIQSGYALEAVLVDEAHQDMIAVPAGVPAYLLPEHVLAAVCDTKTPQGVAAVVKLPEPARLHGRIVAMDGVQDPGNVGTIIRTADAAGFDGVLLSGQCADVYSHKVLRATMGSVFHLPLCITDDLPGVLTELKGEGVSVISSQLDGDPFYGAVHGMSDRFCLVIGNEGNGVSDEVKAVATHRLKLPMRGRAESLNASVAAGIMIYELMKQADEKNFR